MTHARRLVALLALAFAVCLGAARSDAYQLFSQPVGGAGVAPSRWLSLPIPLTVDGGDLDLGDDVRAATEAWNDVPTARQVWGGRRTASTDFDGDNYGKAWGKLTGDGAYEVVVDEDGSALRALGLEPSSINGYGPSRRRISGGAATIDDMYLIVNGQRDDFDRRATMTHELGHTLGIAHSTVGFSEGRSGVLESITSADVPTMHPYSVDGGSQRQTLEADDVAAVSELYNESTFVTSTGTLTGTVTRCGTGAAVLGANVRVVNVANPSIQLTRVTGFDGEEDGRWTINGVPPGTYRVFVEPLSGDADFLGRLEMYTRVDTDFVPEFYSATEDDCAADGDVRSRAPVSVGAAGLATANLRVSGAQMAFVVDTTGSMSAEIAGVRAALRTYIDVIDLLPGAFPDTAIVTFKDDVTVETVTRDTDTLKDVVDGLSAAGGDDCAEASNAALIAAGSMLARNGRAVLVTDADSRPDGPSRESVLNLFRGRGARLSTILTGSCSGSYRAGRGAHGQAGGDQGDSLPPVDELGGESSIATFSELSTFTGGLFAFDPDAKSGSEDAATAYANRIANVAISSVSPAVAALTPGGVSQGNAVTVELTGSNTNFRPTSRPSVAGSDVKVTGVEFVSPTQLLVTLDAAPAAAVGFRDVSVVTDLGGGTTETAKGIGALQVTAPPSEPTITAVAPSSGARGATLDVTVSGAGTTFVDGSSQANFGGGVTVKEFEVSSPTSAVATISVAPGADIGFRDVTVTTGSEVAAEQGPGPFLVTSEAPKVPVIASVTPAQGARGSAVDVTVTGVDTTFAAGTSVGSVSGTGVTVLATTVTGPGTAVLRLQIAGDATLGVRDVFMTTDAEIATLLSGFRVVQARSAPPSTGNGGTAPAVTPGPSAPAPMAPAAAPSAPLAAPCADTSAPSSRLRADGIERARGRVTISGTASDAGCATVGRVEVAVGRKVRSGCVWLRNADGDTRRRSCRKPVFVLASGAETWSAAFDVALRRGRYRFLVRAADDAGNLQDPPSQRRVRVRKGR